MQTRGLKLNIVRDGGGADQAGLQSRDVLLTHGGQVLDSAEALSAARANVSGNVRVRYLRNGVISQVDLPPGTLDVTFAETEVDPMIEQLAAMIVSTSPFVDGYQATRQLGVVSAECVFGLNVFKDFFTALSDVFGGRSQTTQSALRQARETCIAELKREAAERGANAVIAVDLDYSEFSGQGKSMLFLVASGTAVFLEPKRTA